MSKFIQFHDEERTLIDPSVIVAAWVDIKKLSIIDYTPRNGLAKLLGSKVKIRPESYYVLRVRMRDAPSAQILFYCSRETILADHVAIAAIID